MSPWTRHLMSLSLLLAVLAGPRTQWLDALSASWAALSDARQTFGREEQRGRGLAGQTEAAQERTALKEAVVRRLLAGELTLLEAAAQFKYLNEQTGSRRDYFRERNPSLSGEEAACRQVITWAFVELKQTAPDRAAAAVARLEAELEAQLRIAGKVELPAL